MKNVKYFIALVCSLFFADFYAMYKPADKQLFNADVQVYFSPNDQEEMRDKLFSLLDKATHSVYVIMYWITDDSIIDRLIELKKKNINVQIIFDASSPGAVTYMNKLLNNNIIPILYPSKLKALYPSQGLIEIGIMHNKFFVIDHKTVVTGSANFTRQAFDPTAWKFNFENVIILYSDDIAPKFVQELINIRQQAFDFYVRIFAGNDPRNIPQWLLKLGPLVWEIDKGRHNRILYNIKDEFNEEQQRRIFDFFQKRSTPSPAPQPSPSPAPSTKRPREESIEKDEHESEQKIQKLTHESEPAEPGQQDFLIKRGKYIEGMTKQQASDLIEEIKKSEYEAEIQYRKLYSKQNK